jgi:hypothetical protein
MLYRKIIAVCSENHTIHMHTLCGQNVEFVNVKLCGTCSNHWAVKVSASRLSLRSQRNVSVLEVCNVACTITHVVSDATSANREIHQACSNSNGGDNS